MDKPIIELLESTMNRVITGIIKQTEQYKIHKNKQEFLDGVSSLINARDKFSEVMGLIVIIDSTLKEQENKTLKINRGKK